MPLTFRSSALFTRTLLIAGILFFELLAISAYLTPRIGLRTLLAPFLSVTALIGYQHLRPDLDQILWEFEGPRFNPLYFTLHLLVLGALVAELMESAVSAAQNPLQPIFAACIYAIAAAVSLFLAFLPGKAVLRLAVKMRVALGCGLAASMLSKWMEQQLLSLWNQSAVSLAPLAFRSIASLLRMFVSQVSADPQNLRIGAPNFHVTIAPACSGVEGLGLILILMPAWLWFFRSEIRFPRALLLVPCALLAMWMANIVRIVALILIGSAAGKEIAMAGFHSAAGWVAFNTIALAFCGLVCHMPWFLKEPSAIRPEADSWNLSAAYLMPFLAILTASFFTRALSGHFEWLYPLRFVSAATVLWYFRDAYKSFRWTFAWSSPVLGGLVFVVWILLARAGGPTEGYATASGLASLSPPARLAWLVLRVAAAVVTAPLAEELAFRGFIARRLMAADFDRVKFSDLSWLGIAGSSLLFGAMHGSQWLAGIVAGLAYAGATRRHGRISDGIAAHVTTNALLAVWVIWRGDWGLW